MLILKTLLFACAAVAHAAPTWYARRSLDVKSRGIDDLNAFEEINTRGFEDLDLAVIQARTNPKFAQLSPGDKGKAKDFVNGAKQSQIQNAASPGNSAKTVVSNGQFHLDRQQPSSVRHAGKIAVQLNQPLKHKGPTTVGQVVVPHGTNPDPKTVSARLKHSINTGQEQHLPNQSKKDRKAANVAKNDAARKAKQSRDATKHKAGVDRAKAGVFKKGNGKPSSRRAGH
jgi:hypothetical protein